MGAEARLKELGLVLPVLAKPAANYLPYRLTGNLLFLAGQGPRDERGAALTGKLGAEIGIEEGCRRARLVGLGLLAAMRDAHGPPPSPPPLGRAIPSCSLLKGRIACRSDIPLGGATA